MLDSTRSASTILSFIRSSIGSWQIDRCLTKLNPQIHIYYTNLRALGIFQDKYVVKMRHSNSALVEHELRMMLLAGQCSVPPLGRALVSAGLSPAEKLKIIYQLSTLVSRLHGKGIIHRDIKPSNLLLSSDGELQFCDFEGAMLESEGRIPRVLSMRYLSPSRCANASLKPAPLSKLDDLYAVGVNLGDQLWTYSL
jgi:serine/threonine protein kinase